MNLQKRRNGLSALIPYLAESNAAWREVRLAASQANPWFTEPFIQQSADHLVRRYLDPATLDRWLSRYEFREPAHPKHVGIVMAGNIPMVGFHDLLCSFLSGHVAHIKTSSKDPILMPYLVKCLHEILPESQSLIRISPMLKGCDAYIATGNDSSADQFEKYFGAFPRIIRRNRTSVALLTGQETPDELKALSFDIHSYFGLGCRNVTQIHVPEGYSFEPLIQALTTHLHHMEHPRYRNNYDFQLSLLLLNRTPYMSSGATLLREDPSPFTPIGMVHYQSYESADVCFDTLSADNRIQCIVGYRGLAFGEAQNPGVDTCADGIDTLSFLLGLA